MKGKILVTILPVLLCTLLYAQRLDRFAMSKFAAGGERGVAYPMGKSFFGKLPTHSIPRALTKSDTTIYYIYLWLPQPVKEIGLQLISPVPQFASAWKGDYEAEDYHDSLKVTGKYFDPVLELKYVENILSPEEIFSQKGKNTPWKLLGRNDNSQEAPSQPTMMRKNSLFRFGATETDTSYAPAGLYVIEFPTIENKVTPEVTFVLQVGVTEVVPGLKLFRRKDELTEENK
jgi:hypothetical protein